MGRSSFVFALLLPVAALAAGCRPTIGDKCTTSTDCSIQGDRLCDATQPDGYCTIFNCEPGTCPPGEAVCVGFDPELDPACGPTINATKTPRFERTFCMKTCQQDSDCRAGYKCVPPESHDAQVVDPGALDAKICLAGSPTPTSESKAPPQVCGPADAGLDAEPFDAGGGGSGASTTGSTTSGVGGMGGMGGMGAGGMGGALGVGGASTTSGAGGADAGP